MMKSIATILGMCMVCFAQMSCSDTTTDENETTARVSGQFKMSVPYASGIPLSHVHYYLFRKGVFHRAVRNLAFQEGGSTSINVPANAELYFFGGINEPSQLSGMVEGRTTLEEFLSYHTPSGEVHSSTQAPSEFYTARVVPDISSATFNISLGTSVSRIDLDVSEAPGVSIERIYTDNAAATTSFFAGGSSSDAPETVTYRKEFDVPETGKREDLFRIYEKNTPLTFLLEATYGGAPITIRAVLNQAERNKIYKIRVRSAGMNVTAGISAAEWESGEEIETTGDNTKIKIDRVETTESAVVDPSRTTVDVSYEGVTGMKLNFLTSEPLELVSVEGTIGRLSDPEVTQENGKIRTKYEVDLPGNSSVLTLCKTLNMRTTIEGKPFTGKITLNVLPLPYKIPEVTIGKTTWMAFNSTSNQLIDQIYPDKENYLNAEEMYNKDWLGSLGKMFQFGRNYPYTPWESGRDNAGNQTEELSWSNAENAPCPHGYRLPTQKELADLLAGANSGSFEGIPGTWMYNGEKVTAQIIQGSKVTVNGITGTSRLLKLSNEQGSAIYFPFGGMKGKADPSDKNPGLGSTLCLWSTRSLDSNKAYVYQLDYIKSNHPLIPDWEYSTHDKKGFAYVRCIKITFN